MPFLHVKTVSFWWIVGRVVFDKTTPNPRWFFDVAGGYLGGFVQARAMLEEEQQIRQQELAEVAPTPRCARPSVCSPGEEEDRG